MRKKFSDTHLITILSLVQVLTLLVMGYYTGIVGLVGIFIYMQIEPFEQILLNSFSQKFISASIRATTLSSMKLVNAVVASATGYLVGILIDNVGINSSFIWVSTWIAFTLAILLLLKRRYSIKL